MNQLKGICINCNKKIGFLTKPLFNLGRFKDGTELCYSCFGYISTFVDNIKNYNLDEISVIINNSNKNPNEKSKHQKKRKLDFSQNGIILSNRENIALSKEIGESECILKMYKCHFYENIGILVFTEFRFILLVDGIFSMDGIRVYYYNQISRLKIEENSFKFKDLHDGYQGEMEKFSKLKKSDLQFSEKLLKEQIKIHKKYDKDSYPYIIQSYTKREIRKNEFIEELKDWKKNR